MTMSAIILEDGGVPGKSSREKSPFILILFLRSTFEESIGGVEQRGYARG